MAHLILEISCSLILANQFPSYTKFFRRAQKHSIVDFDGNFELVFGCSMHFANSWKNNFAKIGKKCFFAEFTISQDIFKLQQSNIYQTNGNLLRIPQNFADPSYDLW